MLLVVAGGKGKAVTMVVMMMKMSIVRYARSLDGGYYYQFYIADPVDCRQLGLCAVRTCDCSEGGGGGCAGNISSIGVQFQLALS